MSKQQKTLVIALCGALALILLLILLTSLNRPGGDNDPVSEPTRIAETTTAPTPEPTQMPSSEEELGRQALLEEEGEEPAESYEMPID